MPDQFETILNDCINHINRGDTVASCIASYPEYAEELEPMLEAMYTTKSAFASVATTQVKERAKQRMMTAIRQAETKQQPRIGFVFPNILRNMKVLATAAASVVIAIVAYFSVVYTAAPQIVTAIANEEGNFALLISDAPIDEFDSLIMVVDKVHLKLADEARKWIEIDVDDVEVDLTLLTGNNAFEIWRGDVPEGDYTEAVLFSNSVVGTLTDNGTVNIKLPSGKLSLIGDFTVGASEELTDFVYDITVISAGQSGQYILQPNTNESGVGKQINRVDKHGEPQGNGNGQGNGPGHGPNS